ncbi:hypothetical protein DFP91_0872 [Pseudorhodoplanes sinuspersici]|nr:hypothetical protein DFP91_0872 [Pseudorhodoplanes sinuspersici]
MAPPAIKNMTPELIRPVNQAVPAAIAMTQSQYLMVSDSIYVM